ncbi:MAG: hypothetical protein ACK4MX_13025, partial [Thermaurantiacus sp.]
MPVHQILVAATCVAMWARANLIERDILAQEPALWNEVIPLEFRRTGAAVGADFDSILCKSIVAIKRRDVSLLLLILRHLYVCPFGSAPSKTIR